MEYERGDEGSQYELSNWVGDNAWIEIPRHSAQGQSASGFMREAGYSRLSADQFLSRFDLCFFTLGQIHFQAFRVIKNFGIIQNKKHDQIKNHIAPDVLSFLNRKQSANNQTWECRDRVSRFYNPERKQNRH